MNQRDITEHATVSIITGKQKANPEKEWKALKIEIADWSTIVFLKSRFEMKYIENETSED